MNTLQVGADSWWVLRAGAAALLFTHIAGGSVAILSGATALALRKGSRLHVLAGRAFVVAMMAMTLTGAFVAPFLVSRHGDPKYFDSLAGFLTLYLVVTGWMTIAANNADELAAQDESLEEALGDIDPEIISNNG